MLFVIGFGAGFTGGRSMEPSATPRTGRQRVWGIFRKAGVILFAPVVVLGVVSLFVRGGHPPLALVPIALAVLLGSSLLGIACCITCWLAGYDAAIALRRRIPSRA